MLIIISLIIFSIFLFAIASCNNSDSNKSYPTEISVKEAYEKYQTGVFFLDVREDSEWDESHIPNNQHIPLGELESRLDEIPNDREIVVVCRSGNRSQVGRDLLKKAGFDQVTSMAGGIKDWTTAGYPITLGK